MTPYQMARRSTQFPGFGSISRPCRGRVKLLIFEHVYDSVNLTGEFRFSLGLSRRSWLAYMVGPPHRSDGGPQLGQKSVGGTAGGGDMDVGVGGMFGDQDADSWCHLATVAPHILDESPGDPVVHASVVVLAASVLPPALRD